MISVLLRFALYLGLMLVFGVALFGVYGLKTSGCKLLNFRVLMEWTAGDCATAIGALRRSMAWSSVQWR